jgi:hypothetical protein
MRKRWIDHFVAEMERRVLLHLEEAVEEDRADVAVS